MAVESGVIKAAWALLKAHDMDHRDCCDDCMDCGKAVSELRKQLRNYSSCTGPE